jgi:hypothetical protein
LRVLNIKLITPGLYGTFLHVKVVPVINDYPSFGHVVIKAVIRFNFA